MQTPLLTEPSQREPKPPAGPVALPPPLVKPARHPLIWFRQHTGLLAVRAVFAYVGILIVAALYYIVLETHVRLPWIGETNTQAWHNLIPRTSLRHDIRDVAEGLLGGLLGIAFVYNHYRRHGAKNFIDRAEIAVGIPNIKDERKLAWWQVIYGCVLIPVYASVGFFVGEVIVNALHPYVDHAVESQTGNLVFNIKANIIENWPRKVIGFAAAFFFGHRPAKALIDDVQLWFAEQRVARGSGLRFYHTPPFKARYNELVGDRPPPPAGARQARGGTVRYVLTSATLILATAAAAYGYYVLNYIAKHHG
ncbi:MAG TPA: hypothetical protein VGX51_06690 [Solirubrobacteraceae bacterium]|jgi:hypothetical protein|nr:hypothetical protein [Solirubrobacteraceae bacterium]